MSANADRKKGVQIHRGIVYGSHARLLSDEELATAPVNHTHKWTVFVTSAPTPPPVLKKKGKGKGLSPNDYTPDDINFITGGGDDLSWLIKRVTFKLHETYISPSRNIDKFPFMVSETGWGEFSIGIKIIFVPESGERPLNVSHSLKLHHWGPLVAGPIEDPGVGSGSVIGGNEQEGNTTTAAGTPVPNNNGNSVAGPSSERATSGLNGVAVSARTPGDVTQEEMVVEGNKVALDKQDESMEVDGDGEKTGDGDVEMKDGEGEAEGSGDNDTPAAAAVGTTTKNGKSENGEDAEGEEDADGEEEEDAEGEVDDDPSAMELDSITVIPKQEAREESQLRGTSTARISETPLPNNNEVLQLQEQPLPGDITFQVNPLPVHAWQYDEVVFTDPTQVFYDLLTSHPPLPLPSSSLRNGELEGEGAIIGQDRGSAGVPREFTLEMEKNEGARLDMARRTLVKQTDSLRSRLIELEKEQARLKEEMV